MNSSKKNLSGICIRSSLVLGLLLGALQANAEDDAGRLTYAVQNHWGETDAPWRNGGTWMLGGRRDQPIISINITSSDQGETFEGQIAYKGEGYISFKAKRVGQNKYSASVRWGDASEKWHSEPIWIIGGRDNQNVVGLNVSSIDDGKTLNGTVTYNDEGAIGFRSSLRAPEKGVDYSDAVASADKTLNDIYAKLRSQLDDQAKDFLKDEERLWIFSYLEKTPAGSKKRLELIQERTTELMNRLK